MSKTGRKLLIIFVLVFFIAGCSQEKVKEKPKLELIGAPETDTSRAMDQKNQQVNAADCQIETIRKSDKKKKNYTIMIYMVGSNLESRNGAATNDIREIEAAKVDFNQNNIIIYTGGSRRWNYNVPNTKNSVLDMSLEGDERIVAQTAENADMGAPATLAAFLDYCSENYPAEHYGLICWDHGGGPVWGYGADELFGNDSLLLQEMREALETTAFAKQKLDFVGFDACLMGSVEIAGLWKDYASYMISSQELEAGDGWDYSFLSSLDADSRKVAQAIVDSYGIYYEENQSEFYHPAATLSAIDLAKIEKLSADLDEFYELLGNNFDDDAYIELNRILSNVRSFGNDAVSSPEDSYDLIDIGDFVGNYSDVYADVTKRISDDLDEVIISQTSNMENTCGLSLYFPNDNKELYESAKDLEVYKSDSFSSLQEEYNRSLGSQKETDWTFTDYYREGDQICLQLSDEQAKELSYATYTILRRNSFGRFGLSLVNIRIDPDEDNVIRIPADPLVIGAQSDLSESYLPWAFMESGYAKKDKTMRTILSFLSAGADFTDFDRNADEQIQISIQVFDDKDEPVIKDVTAEESGAGLSGKGSIDVSHYKTIIDGAFGAYSPSRDEDGHMKPFYEWESTGIEYYPLDLENNFHFVKRHLSDYDMEFVLQVICKDVGGRNHATDLYDFSGLNNNNYVNINTAKGTMRFIMHDDHAEMAAYEGEDEVLNIPSIVSGKPVTVIGSGTGQRNKTVKEINISENVIEISSEAFYDCDALETVNFSKNIKTIGAGAFKGCRELKDVVLPESLESIGRAAFGRTGIESIEVPASVTYIGGIPFYECEKLKEIKVASGNSNYVSLDGVLYTKDKKQLIQYPSNGKTQYSIVDGCEEIAYGAFSESLIEHIHFNEGLKVIGNNAFFDCKYLKELIFPESLQEIGERAFGELLHFSFDNNEKTIMDKVVIGRNVNYIGAKAFNCLLIKAFEVDEANENYASANGFITNKAKDAIIESPRAMGELIIIPETITTLTDALFDDVDDAREFFISDDTFRFGQRVFPIAEYVTDESGKYVPTYDVLIHCSEGSAAEEYAELFDLEHDQISDPALRIKERVEETTQQGKMEFDVYPDHAVLVGYQGEDTELLIPDTVNNIKVTGIAKRKTYDYSDRVYDGGNLEKIGLPTDLEKIDTTVFGEFYRLDELTISDEAKAFKIENDTLLSKDGKRLFYYFGEADTYKIDDAVEVIGSDSFIGSYIRKVELGSNVEKIEEHAFSRLYGLEEVVFNDKLKIIEDSAFGSNKLKNIRLNEGLEEIGMYVFNLNEDQKELQLPASLTSIGQEAFHAYDEQYQLSSDTLRLGAKLSIQASSFSGLKYKNFEVDPANESYKAQDNLLLSKDGKKLILCASDTPESIYVPEGVEELQSSCFAYADNVRDIYLPDSILYISTTSFKVNYGEGEKYSIVLHCKKDSEAHRYAKINNIPFVLE